LAPLFFANSITLLGVLIAFICSVFSLFFNRRTMPAAAPAAVAHSAG
jgi:hypothetical protein